MRTILQEEVSAIKALVSPCQNEQGALNNSNKEQLKVISDKRVSQWCDTLEAKRKEKLRWKQEREDRKEEKRKLIDQEEEAIRFEKRQETIQRARQLQYEEQEKVRFLRSQQLYTDVMATRIKQVEEKQERDAKIRQKEEAMYQECVQHTEMAEMEAKEESIRQKCKAREVASMMAEQRIESETMKFQKLKQQKEEEAETIRRITEEDRLVEIKNLQKKEDARVKAKQEMAKISEDLKLARQLKVTREIEEEKKREIELSNLRTIANARIQLELKHFEERQTMRKLLSDKASKELHDRAAREVELFLRDQKLQENKEREKEEERAFRREENEKIIHRSRQEQIKARQARKRDESTEDAIFAKLYRKMSLEEQEKEKIREQEQREKAIKIRKMQENQIKDTQNRLSKDKKESLRQEKEKAKEKVKEISDFREFIVREMDRFQSIGKKTDLLEKVLNHHSSCN